MYSYIIMCSLVMSPFPYEFILTPILILALFIIRGYKEMVLVLVGLVVCFIGLIKVMSSVKET